MAVDEPDPSTVAWYQRLILDYRGSEREVQQRAARRNTSLGLRGPRLYLPDDALVIRGGQSSPRSVSSNAKATHRKTGRWGVSGAAGIDIDVHTLVAVYPMPNSSVRRTTAGRLRDAGFEVALTRTTGHCSIFLPIQPQDPLDPSVVQALCDVFDEPEPNPRTRG